MKTILTLLVVAAAVVGGLFTAAVVALASIAVLVTRRLFRSSTRPAVGPAQPAPRPRTAHPVGDVIEVTATEIPLARDDPAPGARNPLP